MQVESIAECSKGSILQYFGPLIKLPFVIKIFVHSAILLTFIKLPLVIKIFVLSIFEWPFYTGFTVIQHFAFEEEHNDRVLDLRSRGR